jgi:hypothetical protein
MLKFNEIINKITNWIYSDYIALMLVVFLNILIINLLFLGLNVANTETNIISVIGLILLLAFDFDYIKKFKK